MNKLIQIAGHLIKESNDFFIDVAGSGYSDLFPVNKYGTAADTDGNSSFDMILVNN